VKVIDMIADQEHDEQNKSKSQRKREMIALQELGEELVRLKAEQLAKLPLSDELREAICAAQGMHARGARYRQMQYIGRLMREVEPALFRKRLTPYGINRTGRLPCCTA